MSIPFNLMKRKVYAMVLTPQEESKLLNDYSKISWKMVNRFCGNRKSSIFAPEDLYQECMLVLVKHMQACETVSGLRNIQTMDLVKAMSQYVLRCQAVHVSDRTDRMKETLQSLRGSVPIDTLFDVRSIDDDQDAVIDFERFIDTLTPVQQEVIRLKSSGYSNKQIAEKRNCTTQGVTDIIRRTHKAYLKYADSVA